jgi:hypothetical protein
MNWTPSTSGTTSTGLEAKNPPWDLEVDEADRSELWEWRVLRSGHELGSGHSSSADLAKASAERFAASDAADVWDEIVKRLGGNVE